MRAIVPMLALTAAIVTIVIAPAMARRQGGAVESAWAISSAARLADASPPDRAALYRPERYGITARVFVLYEHHLRTPRFYAGRAEHGGTFFNANLTDFKRAIREQCAQLGLIDDQGRQLIAAPVVCLDFESIPYRWEALKSSNKFAAEAVLEFFEGDEKAAAEEWPRESLRWHRVALFTVKKLLPDAAVGFYNAPWDHLAQSEPGRFDEFHRDCGAFFPVLYGADAATVERRCRHARQIAGDRLVVPLLYPSDIGHAPLALAAGANTACLWWDGAADEYERHAGSETARLLTGWEEVERR